MGRMEMGSSTRQSSVGVRDTGPGDDDYPNQVGRCSALPAPDTHSLERVTRPWRTAAR
jgi:hypothetical protein